MRNWWDQRSQYFQSYHPPLPGAAKQPAWKWQGRGVHTYTHAADAAAYVASCRQREIDKMHAKAQRKAAPVRSIGEMLQMGVTARLGAAA